MNYGVVLVDALTYGDVNCSRAGIFSPLLYQLSYLASVGKSSIRPRRNRAVKRCQAANSGEELHSFHPDESGSTRMNQGEDA